MATLKRVTKQVAPGSQGDWAMPVGGTELTAPQPPWDEPQPDEQSDTDRVMMLMKGFSGADNAKVKVYKIENGANNFCDTYQPSEFEAGDYSMLREAWGAGKFRIVLYGNHPETGNFGILARENVTLMESRMPKANPIAPQQNDALAQVLQTMMENQRQMNERLMALSATPPVDPMASMKQMLEMQVLMRQAMGDGGQPKQSPLAEIIASIKELRGVASEIIPERDSEPSMMSMLPMALETIKEAVKNQPQPQPQPAPQYQPIQPVHIPTNLQTNPIPENPDVKLTQMLELKKSLNILVTMARNGADPISGAALICEAFHDGRIDDDAIDALEDDKWFEMLSLVEPSMKDFKEWMTNARDQALTIINTPDPEQVDTPT
jgi:hypothetical protein